jgi:hypothetical protein
MQKHLPTHCKAFGSAVGSLVALPGQQLSQLNGLQTMNWYNEVVKQRPLPVQTIDLSALKFGRHANRICPHTTAHQDASGLQLQ